MRFDFKNINALNKERNLAIASLKKAQHTHIHSINISTKMPYTHANAKQCKNTHLRIQTSHQQSTT